eukprot:scaffold27876_cov58-Phaeocystis_antarctica.AAC.5
MHIYIYHHLTIGYLSGLDQQREVEVGRHDVVDGHGAGVASARPACLAGFKGRSRRAGIDHGVPSRLRGEKGQPSHELRQDADVAPKQDAQGPLEFARAESDLGGAGGGANGKSTRGRESAYGRRAHQLWQGDGRVAVGRNQALHELAAGQRLLAGQVALFSRRAAAHIHALEACRQLRLDRQGLATGARSERTHVVRDAPWRVGAEAERLEGQLVGEWCTQSRVVDQHHCDG